MFRLTREVRFGLNTHSDQTAGERATNGFAGIPALTGFGQYISLQVTLAGRPNRASGYLVNIKEVDSAVRERIVSLLREAFASESGSTLGSAAAMVFERLRGKWETAELEKIRLFLSPFLSVAVYAWEPSMVHLSQKFEFSASHRLHNPDLSEEENRELFGKCNNPHGHGHNYELEVTVSGTPGEDGALFSLATLERIVIQTVIDRFDHRNLNLELPEFRQLNPTVENIAMAIYKLLEPHLRAVEARLSRVVVWETSKTRCEYSE